MDKTAYLKYLDEVLEVNSSWRENFGAAAIQYELEVLDEEDFVTCCVWDNLDEELQDELDEDEVQAWTLEYLLPQCETLRPLLRADEVTTDTARLCLSAWDNAGGRYELKCLLDDEALPAPLALALKKLDEEEDWSDKG